MKKISLQNFVKILLLLIWIGGVGYVFYSLAQLNMSLLDFSYLIRDFIISLGFWGSIAYIFIYAIRPIIFFPATLLTALSGFLFGPWWGIIFTIIGENISASIAFFLGKYFGNTFIHKRHMGWLHRINARAKENGFMTVLLMRLLYVPFDLTNYLCGVSDIRFRPYFIATAIGIIPGLVTFVLLGGAAGEIVANQDQTFVESLLSLQTLAILAMSGLIFICSLLASRHLKKKHSSLSMRSGK